MFAKFKILLAVAVSVFWMTMGGSAHSDITNCAQAFKECNDRKGKAENGKDWWACDVYKDETVQGKIGKAHFACCTGIRPPLPGTLTINSCQTAHCDLANQNCTGPQYK